MNKRAPRNRTLRCTIEEETALSTHLLELSQPATTELLRGRVINQDFQFACPFLPDSFVDLLILDPPYNLTKDFNGNVFRAQDAESYASWFDELLSLTVPLLRRTATVYVCSDWQSSTLIYPILDRHLRVRNRITWEREKGRGAKVNWKNNTEDIWFCTVSEEYTFNVDAVKLKRRVLAPYRREDGKPKDWNETSIGKYRLTHPSNLWSDITIPFWSMPENTDHPTQKPEKLFAKLVLASSNPQDFVFDPFLGSGTTAVVAKKLQRNFCGIELNREYCCWALKRLDKADTDPSIQGYRDGVFWERNSMKGQKPLRNEVSMESMMEFFDDRSS
ncbi:MAG: site-specific DNA-methyltransferase [Chloroflexi bacterium]|nr:site-specific DNA-methyltransferase [Chloroflexota bacterium]